MKSYAKLLSAVALCTVIGSVAARAETLVVQDSDRDVIREWVYESHNGCPPGTVMTEQKRWFGLVHPQHHCVIPQGSTVTYYQPGSILPSTVTYTPLPETITTRLPAPPSGAVYVTSGTGVYLVNPQTRTVVDTIKLYDDVQ